MLTRLTLHHHKHHTSCCICIKNHIASCIYPVYIMLLVWRMISKHNSGKQSCLFDTMYAAAMIFLERGSKKHASWRRLMLKGGRKGRRCISYKSQFKGRGEIKTTHPSTSPCFFCQWQGFPLLVQHWCTFFGSTIQPSISTHPHTYTRTRTHARFSCSKVVPLQVVLFGVAGP